MAQDTSPVITNIDNQLKKNQKTISDVLKDTSLMYLHSLTAFREIIKKNARAGEITITAPGEPGVRIVVNGKVTTKSGKPLVNALIYFYQTSDKGWYADTAAHIRGNEGDHRHARLFGYIKTDAQGRFKINTIRPNGYPGSDLAAHIHIQVWKEDGTLALGLPGELQFSDDTRMTEYRRKRSIAEGFLIAGNSGTTENPVYNYMIVSKLE